VSYTISPAAGDAIAFFCVVVIRGGRKPRVVDVISTIDEALGVVVFIASIPLVVNLATSVVWYMKFTIA
jgi:fructose-specific component phosphotransferase system IIB-like protein